MSQISFKPKKVHKKGFGWEITLATNATEAGSNDCRTKDQWIHVDKGHLSKDWVADQVEVVKLSSPKTASCIAIHTGWAVRIQDVSVMGSIASEL